MIRMLIVGYMFKKCARSEGCALRCRSIWHTVGFASSALRMRIPDHSVFSRARHERFRQSDALRGYLRASWRSALRPA